MSSTAAPTTGQGAPGCVYPKLTRFFEFLVRTYRCEDGLYFSDALGSGMDNIARYPDGWRDDHRGIPMHNLYPEVFAYSGLNAAWNRQGRSVDFSAQMALFADNLRIIAGLIGQGADAARYAQAHAEIGQAVNRSCWNEADGFYYDLGYGRSDPPQAHRHVLGHAGGHFTAAAPGPHAWPPDRPGAVLAQVPHRHLTGGPGRLPRPAPTGRAASGLTNYMIVRGLQRSGQQALATRLARQYYWSVAQVFEATGTFWENYAPDALTQGNQSRPDFCGWTGLVPIAVYREFIGEAEPV